jgi:hypothetical protein
LPLLNPSPRGEGLNVSIAFLHPLLPLRGKGARGMRHKGKTGFYLEKLNIIPYIEKH